MILAIIGTRHFGDPKSLEYAKLLISTEVWSARWSKFITGGRLEDGETIPTEGIDSFAYKTCEEADRDCELYVARVKLWDHPEGYRARNIRLATDADHMLCIRDPESRTYGSGWTANYFTGLGKKPWIVEMR